MHRKLVSEHELISFLNMELQRAVQHEDWFFESIVRLRVDDRTGCNWAYAKLKGLPDAGQGCPPAVEKIVNTARGAYNLR